ncbi:TonB-dependent receptor plug domain-containing protein [Kordiimonas sp.]|uniref:TonB-dependent receptor plug domain-containing protein n=1 Tax=Kordiimonas sp. TaxID=1970157 RepID=UPI003A8F5F10
MFYHQSIIRTSVLAGVSAMCLAGVANAQDSDTDTGIADADLETIIVTGTRGTNRTVFSSLAPIDVVSDKAIDQTASEDLLDTLAQTIPSFNVQRLPMADGLVFVRPATLRGLSPDHTLVLVNGKRRHRSALLGSNGAQSPDLATIPSYAIKQVEVLRDGASAQYGSDAIAGVINIILDDEAGMKAFGQFSQYYEGDGDNYRGGAQAGFELGENGFVNGTFEYFDAARTSRSRQRPDAIQFQNDNPDIEVSDPVQNWGQPERSGFRFALNSKYALSDMLSGYLFGTYGEGEGVSDFNWRNPSSTSAYAPSDAFPDFDLNDIYPAGFSPQFGQEDKDISFTGGFEGQLMDGSLSWDLSAGYGKNEIDYMMDNSINASLGPNSPTSFFIGTLSQRETNVNLDFNYELNIAGFDAPVNIAFGGEHRKEVYEIGAGDLASYDIGPGAVDGLPSGSNGFPGFSDSQAGEFDQKSSAAYIDVEVPLTDRWTVGLAGRYEDFSGFGDTLNGKLSTRFELTREFALRATASTGFKAPTAGQLFSERTSQGLDTTTLNIFTTGRFSPVGTVAELVSERTDVNIEPLSAEESDNISLGLVYRNDAGFNLSVDVYQVKVQDRLGTSSTLTLTAEERTALGAAGVPGGSSITRVNFFQNDFDTRTRGFDVVASYAVDMGDGRLSITGAYNYNETKVTDGNLESNETARIRFEELKPKHIATASANYALGALDLYAGARYYGAWTDYSDNASGEIFQKFGGEFFFDASATWHFTDTVSMRAGAENIFNNFPDEATYQANRGLIYSRNAPYDTDGGLYYVRLDIAF